MTNNEVGFQFHVIYKKIYTKWNNYLNIKAKVIKLLEESIWINLHDLVFDHEFLDITPKA